MNKLICLLVLFVSSQIVTSQISTIIPSSASIAQTSAADTRRWTAFHNPAMLGYVEQTEFGIQVDNRYLLPELSTKSVQAGFATKIVNVGISFSHFGYSLYHEMLVGLGFARNFSNRFAMGVQFNYYTAYFSSPNTYRGTLLAQVGISARLSSSFNLGFNTFNPFQTNIKTEYVVKRIPSIYSLGSSYFFTPDLVWRTQTDKEVSSNYRFATGFEYSMLQVLIVKMGAYATDYLVPCLGLGLHVGSFILDVNCELHPLLGLNTLASVKYSLGK